MAELPLTRDQVALVDAEDLPTAVAAGPWCIGTGGYVVNTRGAYLHRLVMGCSRGDGKHVDHWNHNKLDNHRSNLRAGSRARNMQNQNAHRDRSTACRGVVYIKATGRWRAEIMRDGQRKSAYFATEAEASERYEGWRRG